MSRKLASIQKIISLEAIPNADKIMKATILGWECVVKKDEFNVGDLCVYIEVDSIVPDKPEFEFLRDRKFRMRTIKLRKQISQGLALSLSILPKNNNYKEGQDVTGLLGIKKYDPEGELEQKLAQEKINRTNNKVHKFFLRYPWYRRFFLKPKKDKFPSFIHKTDETRIQNIPNIINTEKDTVFSITEKLDGCLSGRMLIQTDNGLKRISDIVNHKLPISVLSYNEKTNQTEFKKIIDYHRIKANKPTYKIGVGHKGKGNRPKFIECTNNHEFFTINGWKRADQLIVGEKIYHSNKNIPNELKEIIIGCLLGDSSVNANSDTGVYRTIVFNHSIKQEKYFDYKKQLFGNLFIEQKDRISGYGSELKTGILRSNLSIGNYINSFCVTNGKKIITQKFANEVTPISLAFWFMDDGYLQNRENKNLRCRAIINSQGFSYEEHIILQQMLKRKFNIVVSIGDKKVYKGHTLIFDVENTEKLCSLIAPYICESMKYKLPTIYENASCFFENITFNTKDSIIETKVLSIENGESNKFGGYVFDLTIEDNHNYFANGILVHNCSATFFLVKNKKRFFSKGYTFGVCSRNLYLPKPNNSSYWTIAKQLNIEEVLHKLIGNEQYVVLQGEIIGEGIQGNKYNIKGYDFYAFNLIYPNKKVETSSISQLLLDKGVKTVPILDTNFKLKDSIPDMVEYAKGKSTLLPILREGIVLRNYDKDISFKVINPEFLLKNKE